MSTLLVSLPLETASSATEWAFAVTPDGSTLAEHGATPAALLPQPRGAGAEVVALVPVQALAWHRVDLPKGVTPATPRMRTALEGLLEERLLDEVEAVHFAVQPGARAGEPAWVGVCDRAWLRTALQVLEAAGRPASRIVPEFAPEGTTALAAIGDPGQPLVVTSGDDGVLTLPLTPAALALLPALPEDAPRVAEPAVAGLAEQMLQQKFALQQAPQRWIAAARTRWDLAQFEFASSAQARTFKKIASRWGEVLHAPSWRPARWAAVVLVAVHLVGLNAWAWKERASFDAKREAVRRTLTDTFPQVKVVVDAPVQMEREVAALRQQTGVASARDLDAVLGALAATLPQGRVPASLQYGGGELRAGGLALSPTEFTTLAASLKNLGYAASTEGSTIAIAAEDAR